MVTFEEMTEVASERWGHDWREQFGHDFHEQFAWLFLSLFIDFYHVRRSKGNCLAEKDACAWQDTQSICALYMNQDHFRAN